ncbi:hypothetical protein DMA12_43870 [Amycolatopsis balhimycina DSM 5908]|uniref:DUF2637 domain-containing protein n=1 Tax=Amycolatopsis balhimycina DSM 5908 TaxID=1081091 RepID=A0A428VXI0_AMYBA|nr:hypothetical protein [Amycolatopsis balhimycina]RSM35564.1 hypothetical protein DMA12_43870 [Amycolatopsis balhimycina DSM 5908]
MTLPATNFSARSESNSAAVVQVVTVIMGVVIGLTFLFGFGNVLNLALRLGVPVWVAPLVAPAVDLSILGLLLGSRHLALAGAAPTHLRPARRLLIFASLVTLASNVADPVVVGQYGKAAFDAVGPLLLIGWAEVGPDLLRALTTTRWPAEAAHDQVETEQAPRGEESTVVVQAASETSEDEAEPDETPADNQSHSSTTRSVANDLLERVDNDLLERAREEDARHWDVHRRPISADTLRTKLRIGAARSRLLVAIVRADSQRRSAHDDVTAQAGV